ncbi:hypothetical protein EBBID32_44270 [Sphingobium indicum BiD32]|uniref:Uncharacterized protein n=1 Tax=Sphingobium indicum BiD32 TaxID=1301087 RepID=N1MSU3_9SPHN|nr:hypothetical protein EBBID32_44270 [Sphingobium indicum BiD32]
MGVQLLSKRHRQIFSLPIRGVMFRSIGACICWRRGKGWNVPAMMATPVPQTSPKARLHKKCFIRRNHQRRDLFRSHMDFSILS